jgi:hypothetical protein
MVVENLNRQWQNTRAAKKIPAQGDSLCIKAGLAPVDSVTSSGCAAWWSPCHPLPQALAPAGTGDLRWPFQPTVQQALQMTLMALQGGSMKALSLKTPTKMTSQAAEAKASDTLSGLISQRLAAKNQVASAEARYQALKSLSAAERKAIAAQVQTELNRQ